MAFKSSFCYAILKEGQLILTLLPKTKDLKEGLRHQPS